jgi:hypothetical protein
MNKINIKHSAEMYENLFNMYEVINENSDAYIFYNILNKPTLPDDVDDSIFDYYLVEFPIPLTTLSYNIYNNIHLWWLIMIVNKIQNPVLNIESGSVIKIVKPEYLNEFLTSIKEKL